MNGRELDAAVAEKVMGWKFTKPRHGNCCTCQHCGRSQDECYGDGSCEYSTDIAAAWQVVGKLLTTNHNVFIDYLQGDGWNVTIWSLDDDDEHKDVVGYYVAPTAPEAICRAALKAMET